MFLDIEQAHKLNNSLNWQKKKANLNKKKSCGEGRDEN